MEGCTCMLVCIYIGMFLSMYMCMYVHVCMSLHVCMFNLFALLLYVPSQQLWSLRDGKFTKSHFFLCRLEQAVNQ